MINANKMVKKKRIQIYDDGYAGAFLIYIFDRKKIMKSELREIASPSTLTDTIDFLEERGLIEIEEQRAPRTTLWITLTDEGERIARLYKAIRDGAPTEDNFRTPADSVRIKG